MDMRSMIATLEAAWDEPDGVLARLRAGAFDAAAFERLLQALQAVDLEDAEQISRQFVALVWFIPTFMSWQRERVQEHGGDVDALENAIDRAINVLYTLLGTP